MQTQLKIAAALAILDGRVNVSDIDWELASVVMVRSAATRASVQVELSTARRESNTARALDEADRTIAVSDRVADAQLQRVMRNVVRRLGLAGVAGMGRNDIKKIVAQRDREALDEALDRLVSVGMVVAGATAGRGSKGQIYRLSTKAE